MWVTAIEWVRAVVRGQRPPGVGVVLWVGAAGVLALALATNGVNTATQPSHEPSWPGPPPSFRDWLPLVSGALVSVAVLAVFPRGAGPRRTALGATAVGGIMLATSLVLWPGEKGTFGYSFVLSEGLALALAVTLTALRCRPRTVVAIAALGWVTLASDTLRSGRLVDIVPSSLTIMVLIMLAPGLYLRWRSAERERHIEQVRREERLALARDLHDVVAHQVTGIVVQVQALRHVAARDPGLVVGALPDIEEAGGRALTAMRRLVGTLREGDEAPLEASDTAAALRALEAPSEVGRPRVEVLLSGDVGALPSDTAAAVVRMAQEGVSNALRHARDATRVEVAVEATDEGVVLQVRDDGRGGPPRSDSGGYGLTGMAERAKLLGGTCTAGPAGDGPGWRVRAELPTQAPAGAQ